MQNGRQIMMIKEYLYRNEDAYERPFIDESDFETFIRRNTRFGVLSKLSQYYVVIGTPVGIGEDPDTKFQSPLYLIYGIATQTARNFLLGRKTPSTMDYDVTLDTYSRQFKPTLQYAVTNDISASTDLLAKHIQKDHRIQVSGVIVDKLKKLIILTSTLPSDMMSENLEPITNEPDEHSEEKIE